jgi:hypothetical protein
MNTLSDSERRRMGNVALDALGTICASERGDIQAIGHLINHLTVGELAEFTVAAIAHGGNILRLASEASGVAPEEIAAAIAQGLREQS